MNKKKKNRFDKDPKNKKRIQSIIVSLLLCLVLTVLFSQVLNRYKNGTQETISYSQFLDLLEEKKVDNVVIGDHKITVTPTEQKNPLVLVKYVVNQLDDYQLVDRLEAADVEYSRENTDTNIWLSFLMSYIFPFVLFYGLILLFMRGMGRGGGMMGVGKSNAKVYVEQKTGVTFDDVAGQDEAKESLTEMVDFLHNPQKYLEIGAKLPKGALLVGPPGTGKTLLAKAVAGEAGVPFFSLSGSDFVEMFVGVGASRVRDLFKQAQSMAPCIIFIDEVDAIGKSRDSHYGGGNDEREQTLNALLAEMDGFDTSKGLIILAATNRPEVLDKALLRPGRFDRRVIVERPDLKGRVETLKVHAKNVLMDETVDFDELALATSGAVGSDLANMINEAALAAVKAGRKAVSQKDLMEAVEIVIAGKEKKDRILNDHEKRIVSYHEVGHALCIAAQKHAEPVQKITIVPRTMGALGYTLQVPEEERYLMSREEILADLVTFCGGRAAEQVEFQSVTTGASNDIERATAMARAMVTMYGMSERFGMMGLESIQNRYLDGRAVLNCSDVTEAQIDEEVRDIMNNAYKKAIEIVTEYKAVLDEAAQFLIEKETITGKEFMEIFDRITKPDAANADSEAAADETDAAETAEVTAEAATDETDAAEAAKASEEEAEEATETAEAIAEAAADEAGAAEATETAEAIAEAAAETAGAVEAAAETTEE